MRKAQIVIIITLLLGLVSVADAERDNMLLAAGPAQESDEKVDDRATDLRKRLGDFCRSFDFYYRHSFARGVMRPVRCSRRDRTVVLVYSFSDRNTKYGWVSEWGGIAKERGAPVIKGGLWAAEVLVDKHAQEIRRRLTR